jgi:hypothetical protein
VRPSGFVSMSASWLSDDVDLHIHDTLTDEKIPCFDVFAAVMVDGLLIESDCRLVVHLHGKCSAEC